MLVNGARKECVMKKIFLLQLMILFAGFPVLGTGGEILMKKPVLKGAKSVEEAVNERRSIRNISGDAVSAEVLSQILWAAQGVTDSRGLRTAPSAGATYPLETYAVLGKVTGIPPGVYRYNPEKHSLEPVAAGDVRKKLSEAALSQRVIEHAPFTVVFTAVYDRTKKRYGTRGEMYVHMEAGHAGQNIYLQCVSWGLATVAVGAFREKKVAALLKLPDNEVPLYIFPVGKPQK